MGLRVKGVKPRRLEDSPSGLGLEDSPSGLGRVTAAILAGGRGTRLRSVVADRPKVLASVHGRPYLTFLLDRLAACGLKEVVLLTGYRAEQVLETVGERYRDMRLIHSAEATPLDTGGAVRNALPYLRSDQILLLNGDSWCDVGLFDFWRFHRLNQADLTMVLAEAADPSRYGAVQVAPDGRLVRFQEKTAGDAAWINAGIYLIARRLIAELPPGEALSLERLLIPRWIEEGRSLFGYRHAGRFLDIGTPASYATAEQLVGQS